MDGVGLDDPEAAFHVEADAAPVVGGFTVTGYAMGVEAFSASGDWVSGTRLSGTSAPIEAGTAPVGIATAALVVVRRQRR